MVTIRNHLGAVTPCPAGPMRCVSAGDSGLQELAAGASAPGQHVCPCPLPGIYQATKLSLSIESKC